MIIKSHFKRPDSTNTHFPSPILFIHQIIISKSPIHPSLSLPFSPSYSPHSPSRIKHQTPGTRPVKTRRARRATQGNATQRIQTSPPYRVSFTKATQGSTSRSPERIKWGHLTSGFSDRTATRPLVSAHTSPACWVGLAWLGLVISEDVRVEVRTDDS